MDIEEFKESLIKNLDNFEGNMKVLDDSTKRKFPDWIRMFCRWMEIGTYMEEEYYGKE